MGSGLGELAQQITDAVSIPYTEIPNFPTTTVPGHEGTFIIGKLSGEPIIGLKDRKHFYEVAHEPFNNGILKSVFAVHVHLETYLAVTGPTFEKEGECLAFRDGLGADCVGMSTTPEVIVAQNRNMKVVGFSCVTNTITKEGVNATNHEEVQEILNSEKITERLSKIVVNFFTEFAKL